MQMIVEHVAFYCYMERYKVMQEYNSLTVLEVVKKDMKTLRLNTIVLDDNTAAANDLTCVALTVNLAETGPGTKDLGISNLDQVDLVLGAKGLNEFNVLGLSAGLDEDTKVGLTLIESLGALAETTRKTIVNEGVFQNLLESLLNSELSLGGFGGDLNLSNGVGGIDGNVISSVRHLFRRF